MKLFYSPGACSLATHIVLHELELKHEIEKVTLSEHLTESGKDYYTINSKGSVPALQLDSGDLLTENTAILEFLADSKPEAKLAPPFGTMERARLHEWLSYLGSELHKAFVPLFRPERYSAQAEVQVEIKLNAKHDIEKKFKFIADHLQNNAYLLGSSFSVADPYLFVMLRWASRTGPDLKAYRSLSTYFDRMRERPAIVHTLKTEGLS